MTKTSQLIKNISTSFIICCQLSIICATFAALLFHTLPTSFQFLGTILFIIGTAISMWIIGVTSKIPFTLSVSQDDPLSILSLIIIGSLHAIPLSTPSVATSTSIAALIITTCFTGLMLYSVGLFRLGSVMKSIPFSVSGGFLTGVGLLLLIASGKALFFQNTHCSQISLIFGSICFWKGLLSFLTAFFLYTSHHLFKHPLAMPFTFFLMLILFFFSLYGFNISIDFLINNQIINAKLDATLHEAFQNLSIDKVYWHGILMQSHNILAVSIIAVFAAFSNLAGIEVYANQSIDFNKEIRAIGRANMIAGCFASNITYPSCVISFLNFKMNGPTRLPAFITPVMLVSLVIFAPKLILFFPSFLLYGFLLFIGFQIVLDWGIKTYRKLDTLEYLLLLAIALTIATIGAFDGIILGMIAATILFSIKYSKISPIRYMANGSEISSNIQYEGIEKKILLQNSEKLLYVSLQNYIFFGSINFILEKITDYLKNHGNVSFIFLDCIGVLGFDSSAIFGFNKMMHLTVFKNRQIIFSGIHPSLKKNFDVIIEVSLTNMRLFSNSNEALIWYENKVLENVARNKAIPLSALFTYFGVSLAHPKIIETFFETRTLKQGESLCQEGDEATELYYLESGELESYLASHHQTKLPLRILRAGNIIGEIGFYLKTKRSTSLVAKTRCTIRFINHVTFQTMQHHHPAAAAAIETCIIKMLSERLTFANKQMTRLLK